jgi:hypothetical protein
MTSSSDSAVLSRSWVMRAFAQLISVSLLLVACTTITERSESSAPTDEQSASAEQVTHITGNDPDVEIANYSSLEDACRKYKEQSRILDVIKERVEPYILDRAYAVHSGEIDEKEFQRVTTSEQQEKKDSAQRYLASEVAVLRAAGYSDWEMYSRYSHDGIGDLWDKNIIAGEKVAENPDHPHYKYTYKSLWTIDAAKLCQFD